MTAETTNVGLAYSARSAEYIKLFGDIESTHAVDQALIGTWAAGLAGEVLDVGCGPGQWTSFLASLGVTARGIDPVPEFVNRARNEYPHLIFDVGSGEAIEAHNASLEGILAWYSLIHHDPTTIQRPLREFARVLKPGGGLVVGFFEGSSVERFDHAVTVAYRWPVDDLVHSLEEAGFDTVETHTRTGPSHRPHAAIVARRRETQSDL